MQEMKVRAIFEFFSQRHFDCCQFVFWNSGEEKQNGTRVIFNQIEIDAGQKIII
jgi:hypothetical protein